MSAPLFSVVVPVFDTAPDGLRACVASVLAQEHADWELLLVDDGSTDPRTSAELDLVDGSDPRIRVLRLEENRGIAGATQAGVDLAGGEFLALLDHDDVLDPSALRQVAWAVGPEVDVVYTDEDKVDLAGRHYDAFRKPDWSPERLRSQNYLGHLLVLRTALVREVGGFRSEMDGSQDYDVALRVTERARVVAHVPEVLYSWRASPGSVAAGEPAKPYAYDAAERALAGHCARTGLAATVEKVHAAGIYRLHRAVPPDTLVSIVIPTRGSVATVRGQQRTLVVEAVRSIVELSTHPSYEVVVVADAPTPQEVLDELRALLGERLVLVAYDRPFDFSEKIDLGVLAARGEHVLLLNDDVEVVSPDWIEAMLGLALQPGVGMVGAKLLYEDGTLQHGGHWYTGGAPFHIAHRAPAGVPGLFGALLVEREVCGVTAACALLPREVFLEVGGLSPELPVNFNDVDLSMKVRASGRRIVWTPHAQLHHYESATRERVVGQHEIERMQARWHHAMLRDPYWPVDGW